MKLRDWLVKEGLSPTEFARRLKKPQATVARYVNGDRVPERETMANIARETGGGVMPNDFYDIAPPLADDRQAAQLERQEAPE
jgi:transcriptional regulator with XRE-family HTH domain